MLDAQPPTQPSAGVLIHGPIGFADRPKTEVICQAVYHLVELGDDRLVVQQGCTPSGFVTARLTDAHHALLGRDRA